MRASAQHYLARSIKLQLQFRLLHNCYGVALTRTKQSVWHVKLLAPLHYLSAHSQTCFRGIKQVKHLVLHSMSEDSTLKNPLFLISQFPSMCRHLVVASRRLRAGEPMCHNQSFPLGLQTLFKYTELIESNCRLVSTVRLKTLIYSLVSMKSA